MTDYLDKKHKANKTLDASISNIRHLADAFSIVGNSQVADELFFIANNIVDANDLYEESIGELFDSAYQATQNATANMINAALVIATKNK